MTQPDWLRDGLEDDGDGPHDITPAELRDFVPTVQEVVDLRSEEYRKDAVPEVSLTKQDLATLLSMRTRAAATIERLVLAKNTDEAQISYQEKKLRDNAKEILRLDQELEAVGTGPTYQQVAHWKRRAEEAEAWSENRAAEVQRLRGIVSKEYDTMLGLIKRLGLHEEGVHTVLSWPAAVSILLDRIEAIELLLVGLDPQVANAVTQEKYVLVYEQLAVRIARLERDGLSASEGG